MKTSKVLCFGEILIDMIATEVGDLPSVKGFLKNFGGAPANTAIGLAKLGIPVMFVGKVGNDPFGLFLKRTLEKNNVATDKLIVSDTDHTTLAFVSLTETGERDFSFYKGAHEVITSSDVDLPSDVSILHFGSLLQTTSENLAATTKLINQAKKNNTIISYDPNIRESLWGGFERAKQVIFDTMEKVDIVKVNEEEAHKLSGETSPNKAAAKLFKENLDAFFITRGKEGCYYKTKTQEGTIQTIDVTVVDTTGAGDAFNAGYLSTLAVSQKRFSDMTPDELHTALQQATTIASLSTTKKGAITAFPTKKDIEAALQLDDLTYIFKASQPQN